MMSQQTELLTENPAQWTTVSFVTPEIQKKELKPFVLLALKELEGNPDSRMSSLMNADKFSAVRSVVRHVSRLRSANKEPWSEEDMQMFLEGLKFTPECVSELTAMLCTDKIYNNIQRHLRIKPGVASLQWKIDFSLSQTNIRKENSSLDRSKEIIHRDTQIILTLELTNGHKHLYRMSVNKFQELRFVIASALKNIIVLEKRKCMRKD
ncbi:uncharacterized protein LOC119838598 [Zerene cesonia]|uniref:uncharacterized protein LOC119838598 n=1 Tax=Zerene cesonia TaxID=33412 RepID=UPI0018E52F35|nr:uncharacterized protein LOC119838598 [Zerene cesonia]